MGEGGQSSVKCIKVVKVMNLISALVIVGFGIAGLIFMAIGNLLSGKFFLVFSPIFMILFGVMVFAAECNVNFIIRHFGFLQSLIGRGIFNIYLSSIVFYYFACDSNNDVAGWILASIMFVMGVVYLFLHCCAGGKEYNEEMREKAESG